MSGGEVKPGTTSPLAEIGRDQLMALIDHTSAVIYMRDADGRYLLVNREYERLFGLRREDIVGLTDHDLFPRDIADAFRQNDLEALAGGVPVQMEEEAPGEDGSRAYITVKFPLIDADGHAYAVAGISTDITKRSRAEAALRDSEERFRLLAEHAQDIIFRYRLEPEPGMEYLSRAVESITGRRAEEYYANPRLILDSVLPDDLALFEQSWRALRTGTITFRLRRRTRRSSTSSSGPAGSPTRTAGWSRSRASCATSANGSPPSRSATSWSSSYGSRNGSTRWVSWPAVSRTTSTTSSR